MTQPNLYLVIGAPGAGKSTFCSQKHLDKIVLSSDRLRGVVGTSEADQTVSHIVFRTMENMTGYFLSLLKDVVIDATNLNVKNRKGFVQMGRRFNAKIIAQVIRTSLQESLRRNAIRSRFVPVDIITNMHASLQIPLVGEVDEIQLF